MGLTCFNNRNPRVRHAIAATDARKLRSVPGTCAKEQKSTQQPFLKRSTTPLNLEMGLLRAHILDMLTRLSPWARNNPVCKSLQLTNYTLNPEPNLNPKPLTSNRVQERHAWTLHWSSPEAIRSLGETSGLKQRLGLRLGNARTQGFRV